jgi:hypothetical protein
MKCDTRIYHIFISNNVNLAHTKTVIIPRDRYRPEDFSPRVDIGRGMITVWIWKKACINLFITYFNIELKRTKLASHTHHEWKNMEKGMHCSIYKEVCYHELLNIRYHIIDVNIWFELPVLYFCFWGLFYPSGAHEFILVFQVLYVYFGTS